MKSLVDIYNFSAIFFITIFLFGVESKSVFINCFDYYLDFNFRYIIFGFGFLSSILAISIYSERFYALLKWPNIVLIMALPLVHGIEVINLVSTDAPLADIKKVLIGIASYFTILITILPFRNRPKEEIAHLLKPSLNIVTVLLIAGFAFYLLALYDSTLFSGWVVESGPLYFQERNADVIWPYNFVIILKEHYFNIIARHILSIPVIYIGGFFIEPQMMGFVALPLLIFTLYLIPRYKKYIIFISTLILTTFSVASLIELSLFYFYLIVSNLKKHKRELIKILIALSIFVFFLTPFIILKLDSGSGREARTIYKFLIPHAFDIIGNGFFNVQRNKVLNPSISSSISYYIFLLTVIIHSLKNIGLRNEVILAMAIAILHIHKGILMIFSPIFSLWYAFFVLLIHWKSQKKSDEVGQFDNETINSGIF